MDPATEENTNGKRVKFAQASLTAAERSALTESATALIAQFEQAVEATPQQVQPQ